MKTKKFITIAVILLITMEQSFAQNIQEEIRSKKNKIINLDKTDSIFDGDRITVRANKDSALVKIYYVYIFEGVINTEPVISQISIKWGGKKLFSIHLLNTTSEGKNELIFFDGMIISINNTGGYYVPSNKGTTIINKRRYLPMEEADTEIFDDSIREMLSYIEKL